MDTTQNTNQQRSIDELTALKPGSQPGAETLTYPGIRANLYNEVGELVVGSMNTEISAAESKQPDLWDAVEHGNDIDSESAAHEIARYNLVRSAREMHKQSTDKKLWADRYRQASTELYGGPEEQQAAGLIQGMVSELADIEFTEGSEAATLQQSILSVYGDALEASGAASRAEVSDPLESMVEDAQELGEYLRSKYADIFALVDDESALYDPEQQAALAQSAIELLAKRDADWSKVQVKMDPNAAHLSVSSRNKDDIYISIGAHRPAATGLEMKGLLIHELVWHLGRGINGWKMGDPKLASGMPGYEAFEEGGGVYAEVAVTGVMPTKHKDRYVDIALATGEIGDGMSRRELTQIVFTRNLLRLAAKNNGEISNDMKSAALKAAQGHTDRIYKGGIGDESEAGRAGVFTKDVIYYGGAVSYHARDRQRQDKGGYTAAQMFEFDIASGKIVATNETHTAYVADKGIVLAGE